VLFTVIFSVISVIIILMVLLQYMRQTDYLILYRSTLSMDQQQRLKQSLGVFHPARKGRRQLLEPASMLVHRHRQAQVQQNSRARQNNGLTVCEAVIGCKKCPSLSGNSSHRLLLVKGDNADLICRFANSLFLNSSSELHVLSSAD